MSQKFLTDFYFFNNPAMLRRRAGQWMLFDAAREDIKSGMAPRAKYAKTLAELLLPGLKMLAPVFLFVEPTAAGIFVPVTLINGEYAITVLATPDSGAQVACFNGELALPLGINIKKLKKAKSFEGPGKFAVDSYPFELDIVVGGIGESRRVTIDFLKTKQASTLLGWSAFFATHEVYFNPSYGIKYRLLS